MTRTRDTMLFVCPGHPVVFYPTRSRDSCPSTEDGQTDLNGLFRELYDEIHAIAVRLMREQPADLTLQATDLIGSLYLRLHEAYGKKPRSVAEFRRFVPPVLRSILVDYVRSCKPRHARRTGANLDLDRLIGNIERRTGDLLDLHAALQGLSGLGEAGVRAASIVDLRFFAWLSTSETAAFLGVSERTIERDWTFARSWLRARLRGRPAQRMRADGGT